MVMKADQHGLTAGDIVLRDGSEIKLEDGGTARHSQGTVHVVQGGQLQGTVDALTVDGEHGTRTTEAGSDEQ